MVALTTRKTCDGFKDKVSSLSSYKSTVVGFLCIATFVCCSVYLGSRILPSCKDTSSTLDYGTESFAGQSLPYLFADDTDLLDLLTKTTVNCSNPQFFEGNEIHKEENDNATGHEGSWICFDVLPENPTPYNCRIYSFNFNRYDISLENRMSYKGCRVHLISGQTELNYAEIRKNLYMYPLELSSESGPAKYTLDDFMDLLSHEKETIHYVKTTLNGTEWTLLENIYLSSFRSWNNIKQIRLLVHVPYMLQKNLVELRHVYTMLRGLGYLGYHLVYSRPIPGTIYRHVDLKADIATKYEMVWIKK